MEPKNNTPRKIEIYWSNNTDWDKMDPETLAWIQAYLESMLEEEDAFYWDLTDVQPEPETTAQELADLERVDAQVQGEELPDTLAMIMSAVQRVRDHG